MWISPRRIVFVTIVLAAASGVSAAASGATLPGSAAAATQAELAAPTNTSPIVGQATVRPDSPAPPTLVGVRYGRHDRYDRTVFDFTGGTPGYRVEYGTLVDEGTGRPVSLAGSATLRIVFTGVFAYDIRTGRPTIDLRRVVNPELPTLRQIKFGGAFEGHLSAGLGLRDRVGFRVLKLTNPPRIAVDVAHQPALPFGTARFVGGGSADQVSIIGVRSGRHPGYDRLVFDLRGTDWPLLSVAYTRLSPTMIHVGFTGLTTRRAVVSGPRTVHIGLQQLKSVSFTVYENGTASAFVATASRDGFRVMLLKNPTRLVVDVAH